MSERLKFDRIIVSFGKHSSKDAPANIARITAHLDPLNSYLHLMSTVAPGARPRTDWSKYSRNRCICVTGGFMASA